jgi:hypothetical protein
LLIAYDAPGQLTSFWASHVENSTSPFDGSPPPRRSEPRPTPGAWISILLAGVIGLALTTALFVLMLQFGGPLAVVAVLVFGLGGVIALFHYVVWGWWLGRTIREEVAAEERERRGES